MLASVVAGLTCVALVTYTAVERSHRRRWTGTHGGPRASWVVRGTALLSLVLGPVLLPAAIVCAWLSFAFGPLGIVSFPSLMLGLRTCGDGLGLLRADPRSVGRARTTAGLALFMNLGFVVPIALMLAVTAQFEIIGVSMLGYAALSLVHAGLLRVSSNEVERLWLTRGLPIDGGTSRPPQRLAGWNAAAIEPPRRVPG